MEETRSLLEGLLLSVTPVDEAQLPAEGQGLQHVLLAVRQPDVVHSGSPGSQPSCLTAAPPQQEAQPHTAAPGQQFVAQSGT